MSGIKIPRFRIRKRGDKTYYYYDTGGRKNRKEIALGSDYGQAIIKYGELEQSRAANTLVSDTITFAYVASKYMVDVLPGKAPRTQKDNIKELKNLMTFFNDPPAPLDQIRPQHIKQYLTWRKDAPVRANRERALLSHIWNYAREMGYTDLANPCAGIKGNRESGRDVYIEDDLYSKVYTVASDGLKDAMDLAYLTGQRVADVLKMDLADIRDGCLWIQQNKTRKKQRIQIVGELKALLERIDQRKHRAGSTAGALIVNEDGESMTASMLRGRFDKAREAAGIDKAGFQLRDLRAKAGTDKAESVGDILEARDQLGHTNIATTERYIRQRKGKLVTPTR